MYQKPQNRRAPASRPMPQKRRAPAPRRSAPRRRTTLKEVLANPLVAIALVAFAVVVFLLLKSGGSVDNDYYLNGVYVNSVDMSVYTKKQGEDMLNAWADGILNAKFRFTYQDKVWTASPKDFGMKIDTESVLERAWNFGHIGSKKDRENAMMSLRYSPQYLWTNMTYDEEKLTEFVDDVAESVYVAPRDAEVLLDVDGPQILSESLDGRALDKEALTETLKNALMNGTSIDAALPVEDKPAAISSGDAEDGLQLIVTYSTSLEGSSSARRSNIRLALSNFNAFEVKVGETVSFNEVVGARTALRGYKEATVYYGATVTSGLGGGICQASSTLYAAVLQAGMDIVERHNHTMVVAYCKASMDAAVSEDAADDFVFENNTDYNIYIYTDVTSEEATVKIYGRRPEYRIELYSTILQNDIKNTSIVTVPDETGMYAYYTDEYSLKKEGKLGRRSKLERIYYDWETGQEVKREDVSNDFYQGERSVYWVGIHPVGGTQQ